MKRLAFILLILLPFLADSQVSAARKLLLMQDDEPPTYLSSNNYVSLGSHLCGTGSTAGQFIISVDLLSDSYSGSIADSLEITSINYNYDNDIYAGYSLVTDNWVGPDVTSFPVVRGLDLSEQADPFLGVIYFFDMGNSDVCDIQDISNAEEFEITYRIKGKNGVWGSYKKFVGGIYIVPE